MSGFSDILMEHFQSPRNQGPMEAPDRIGLVGTPGHGPFLLLCLRGKKRCQGPYLKKGPDTFSPLFQ
jgi:hypothetical protein